MKKSDIKKKIRELKKKKVDLSWKNIKADYIALYKEGIKHFGSWKKAVKSTSSFKMEEPVGGFIFGIILLILIVFLWKVFSIVEDYLFVTIYFAVIIMGLVSYAYFFGGKNFVISIKNLITIITSLLFAFFMFMTFFVTNQTHNLTLEETKPKLTVQLTTKEIQWGHLVKNFEHRIQGEQLNSTYVPLPVYITINNYGAVPTQIYNIWYEVRCGKQYRKGVLKIQKNRSSLIKPGDFFEISDGVDIHGNETIGDILPCDVYFEIYGPNFNKIEKIINLIKGE